MVMDSMIKFINMHLFATEIIAAFALCVAAMLMFRKLAPIIQLIDLPQGHSTHEGEIPLIGGLAIYLATMICIVGFNSSHSNSA